MTAKAVDLMRTCPKNDRRETPETSDELDSRKERKRERPGEEHVKGKEKVDEQ